MTTTAFVPLSLADAAALRAGQRLPNLPGYAPTPSLVASVAAGEEAEAQFAAQTLAGIAAVLHGSDAVRLVLAVEVADSQVRDQGGELGEVVVDDLSWPQVLALFADEEDATKSVQRARAAVRGFGLGAALERPEVSELVDRHDLLWFAPTELDQLLTS